MRLAQPEGRTFFITSVTYQRQPLFHSEARARLLIDVLQQNRRKQRFLLHEFVVMPDHCHLLFTPAPDVSLEKAVQFIKGGFSFRVKRELAYAAEIWQASFTEHRIKDAQDYARHREYIRDNPVQKGLARKAEEYSYSSASGAFELDCRPPGLKPTFKAADTRG